MMISDTPRQSYLCGRLSIWPDSDLLVFKVCSWPCRNKAATLEDQQETSVTLSTHWIHHHWLDIITDYLASITRRELCKHTFNFYPSLLLFFDLFQDVFHVLWGHDLMGDEHSDLSSVRKTVAPLPPSLLPPCSWPQFDDVSVVVHRLWLCEFELQFYAVMDGCLCFSVDFQYWCVSATELPFRFYTAKRIFLHYSRGCSMQSFFLFEFCFSRFWCLWD